MRWNRKARQAWNAGQVSRAERRWEPDLPKELAANLAKSRWPHTPTAQEYLHRLEGAFLDMEYGYAIMRPGCVVDESLPHSEMARHFATMNFFAGLPGHRKVFKALRGKAPVRFVESALSLHHPFASNYYHFTIDILPRLELLARHFPDSDPTLVISPILAKQRYFKDVVSRSSLARRKWLVQDGFFVEAGELFIAKPLDGGTPEGIRWYLEALGETPPVTAASKLFLDRSSIRGRTASNREEILPVIEAAGFRLIDSDGLTLKQQAELFSNCTHLASIHGAGLTNMIFRNGRPLEIREIFPPWETSLEYCVLASRLGYGHRWMRGEAPTGSGRWANFRVDPLALQRLLSDQAA